MQSMGTKFERKCIKVNKFYPDNDCMLFIVLLKLLYHQ